MSVKYVLVQVLHLRFAKAKRNVFLVDTKNLGEQAEQGLRAFRPDNEQRTFDAVNYKIRSP